MRDALHWEKTGKLGIFPKSLSVLWTALPSMSVRFVQSFFIIIPKEENFCKYKMFQPPWDRRVNVETDDEHLGLLCHIRGPNTTRQCNHLEPGFYFQISLSHFHHLLYTVIQMLHEQLKTKQRWLLRKENTSPLSMAPEPWDAPRSSLILY